MKIAFVSTYPPTQCGIATYTRRLCQGLAAVTDAPIVVIAERFPEGAVVAADPRVRVDPCFTRREEFAGPIIAAARAHHADVVHLQHAPDILGLHESLFTTLRGLRTDGRRVVMTLHTVFTTTSGMLERHPLAAVAHRQFGELTDHLIVHTHGSREILIAQGVPAGKVSVIPHGTDEPTRGDAARGRAYLGVADDEELLLAFGFIHTQKNLQVLIRALAKVQRPKLRLVLAGKVAGGRWYNRVYLGALRRLAKALHVSERVTIVDRFIEDERVADLHAAASLIAMPYTQGYASASGVVHGAMAMGVPMLCSAGPKFEEVGRHIDPALLIPPRNAKRWAEAIERLLTDTGFREHILARTAAYAEETAWPAVARAHLERYRG